MFTKPFTNYVKIALKNSRSQNHLSKRALVNLGQFYHVINVKIQRKILHMSGGDSYIKPLTEDKALEQGIEFFGEIMVYGFLLSWGLYELNKYHRETVKKEESKAQMLANIHSSIDNLSYKYSSVQQEIEKLRVQLDDIEKRKELQRILHGQDSV